MHGICIVYVHGHAVFFAWNRMAHACAMHEAKISKLHVPSIKVQFQVFFQLKVQYCLNQDSFGTFLYFLGEI